MPKYDDASWHFDDAHSDEACFTHIAFFYAWCVHRGLAAKDVVGETDATRKRLMDRRVSPGAYLRWVGIEKFTHNELEASGNSFAENYHTADGYLEDYTTAFVAPAEKPPTSALFGKMKIAAKRKAMKRRNSAVTKVSTFYDVPDTWESYDHIVNTLDRRYEEWLRKGK